ncbi:hypothetical protein FB45DRAFT_953164 [Roridomyces roridus]|uniref:Uncharacterized protein n=1 Tax=Roridomyces roridus TaxID=1738132 RepID=A0AAD7AZG7_9AGAR|nr:hypothetical protein FB45DRAFT_953164 [Roridomyces roridus]
MPLAALAVSSLVVYALYSLALALASVPAASAFSSLALNASSRSTKPDSTLSHLQIPPTHILAAAFPVVWVLLALGRWVGSSTHARRETVGNEGRKPMTVSRTTVQ